jgi:rhodanese-related sulfurtransferase
MHQFRPVIILALFCAALAGCATIGTSPKGLEAPIEKAALKLASDLKEGGYKTVTTDELKRWLDEGKRFTLVSTLPAVEDRQFGLIPGAVNGEMPKSEKELVPENRERLLRAVGDDKEKPIVVYCGFVACRRSHLGAKTLVESGYKNVYRYPAGIAGWQEVGFPLVK